MRRLIIASLAVHVATAAAPLRAQVAMNSDSVAPSPTAPGVAQRMAVDTSPRFVRVSSDRLPFHLSDIGGGDCGDPTGLTKLLKYVGGPSCKPRMTGTLSRMDADSLVFVRNGVSIGLSMRDVQRVDVRAGRSAWRAAAGGVFGGVGGMLGALMIGIGGGYGDSNGAFIGTAIALTAGGAAIGSYRGGKAWAPLPRPAGAPPAPR